MRPRFGPTSQSGVMPLFTIGWRFQLTHRWRLTTGGGVGVWFRLDAVERPMLSSVPTGLRVRLLTDLGYAF